MININRDNQSRALIVEGLPEDYDVDAILEVFENGLQIEGHVQGTDCLGLLVKTEGEKENAFIFDGFEVEPEDGDVYEISIKEVESSDLARFPNYKESPAGTNENVENKSKTSPQDQEEWSKIGSSTINSKSPENTRADISPKTEPTTEIITENTEEEQQPAEKESDPAPVETKLEKPETPKEAEVKEKISGGLMKLINKATTEQVKPAEEKEEEEVNPIQEEQGEIVEEPVPEPVTVPKEEEDLVDEPVLREVRERVTEKTSSSFDRRPVKKRPNRPTPQASATKTTKDYKKETKETPVAAVADQNKLMQILSNYVDFNSKQDVAKKGLIGLVLLIILINIFRLVVL